MSPRSPPRQHLSVPQHRWGQPGVPLLPPCSTQRDGTGSPQKGGPGARPQGDDGRRVATGCGQVAAVASSVHELVTSVGGWPPRFAGTSPCRAVGCPHRCTGGDGTAPPRPPAPPFSSWAACELRKVACPQGRRGVAGDLVPAVTSAPGHRQFNLTVFRPAASSGLGAVPSLWNKCQNCHPCHPVLLCVSIALRSRGWTRVGSCPPSCQPHPSIPIPPALGWQR